jgi:hypothetical protein
MLVYTVHHWILISSCLVWVQEKESFFCGLDTCMATTENTAEQNSTNYKCENVECKCIPDRMLCGENGSVDISECMAAFY